MNKRQLKAKLRSMAYLDTINDVRDVLKVCIGTLGLATTLIAVILLIQVL